MRQIVERGPTSPMRARVGAWLSSVHREAAGARRGAWQGLTLPALLCVLLGSTYVLVRVLPRDPLLYSAVTRRLARPSDSEQEQFLANLRAKDPPIGSHLPVPWAGQGPRDGGSPRPTDAAAPASGPQALLVLMVGSCSKCIRPQMLSADRLLRTTPGLSVVAVSPSPSADLARFREANRLLLRMYSDGTGKLALQYNAAWKPRAYLLSPSGTLVWAQQGVSFSARQVAQLLAERALARQTNGRAG